MPKSTVLKCDAGEPDHCPICNFLHFDGDTDRLTLLEVIKLLDAKLANIENRYLRLVFALLDSGDHDKAKLPQLENKRTETGASEGLEA